MKQKNNFKKIALWVLFIGGITLSNAQVKVGDNPTTSNANSVLEMESTNKGMLLPRVDLTATTAAAPLAAHVAGMTVYNKATASDVTPGYYYNDGTKWVRLMNAADATALEPWYNVATGAAATANTQDIYQMGNVGIGTTTPHNGLEVYSSTVNPVILSRTSGTANATFSLQNEALNKTWIIDQNNINNNLRFARYMGVTGSGFSGAINAMVITDTGNVGIGTTTPNAKLHIDVSANGSNNHFAFSGAQNNILNYNGFNHGALLGSFDQSTASFNISNGYTLGGYKINFGRGSNSTFDGSTTFLPTLTITDGSNVGIGTTTPSNKLHVTATADPLKLEGLQPGAGTDEVLTTDATGVVRKQTASSIAASSEPWYNVATSFGATSNAQSLYHMGSQVSIGTAANYSNARFQVIPETGTGTIAFFGYGPGTNRPYFMFKNDEAQSLSTIDGNSTTATGKLAFATIGTERMRITETGNVGIGTTTPAEKLDVAGNGIFGTDDRIGIYNGIIRPVSNFDTESLELHATKVNIGTYNSQTYGPNNNTLLNVTGYSDGQEWLRFRTNGNGAYFRMTQTTYNNMDAEFVQNNVTQMMLKSDGNVGIGTTAPSQKLHVIGNILASGTITPDYVFEEYVDGVATSNPSYKRMSLQEVDTFVKENKHLPGVPSAKEVEAQGGVIVNRAAEINLEKIEELYLHVIEQQKQIEALKAELKELKK